MNGGKKQSRRMRGGMTTGEWGTAVYGDSSSQHAAVAGSNVISMNNPNSGVATGGVAAPPMKGGFSLFGADEAAAQGTPTDGGILGDLSEYNPFAAPSAEEAAKKAADEAEAARVAAAAAPPTMGGKGKRKSATKRRKSHKKKGKSSKKRAHKRH